MTSYQVMVKIGLQNQVSPGLLTMSGQITGLSAQVQRLGGVFAQMMAGRYISEFGAKMVGGFKSAVSSAAELQRQMIGIQAVTKGSVRDMTGLEAAIMKVTGVTTFSNVQVAQMAKTLATSNKLSVAQITELIPVFAKFADAQYVLKGMSPQQSVVEAVRLAHTGQHYTPEELTKYLDLLTRASLITPGSLTEVGHALKYSQGVAKTALGISDDQIVLMTALLNRMGFAGSRGGSNLLAAMTRTIPGVFGSGLLKGKSAEALAAMGFIDQSGHSTIFDQGKFSVEKWMTQLSTYLGREFAGKPEALARQDIVKNFQHAFGVQGGRIASLLSNPAALEQLNSLMAEFKTLPGNAAIQGKFADESVWQKAINAQTNFKSILTLLGEKTLPEVSSGLTALNNVLSLIIEKLGSGDSSVAAVSRVAVYGLGSLGAAIMLLGKYLMYAALVKYLGGASAVLGMLGSAAAALVSPVTLAIAALVGLGVAAVAIYSNWDKVKAKFSADMNSARTWLDDLDKAAKKRFPSLFPDGTPNRAGGPPDATIRAPKAGEDLSSLGTGKSYASNYVRGGGNGKVQVNTRIDIDGRKVAEAVTEHQVKESNRALGGGYPDYSYGAPNVGLG
jgi:hypothetical protein